jgi:hypothetical protein
MYEYRGMIFWKQEIGITGKMPVPETIPEAESMQAATENPFRFRIGTAYLGHIGRSMFGGDFICHDNSGDRFSIAVHKFSPLPGTIPERARIQVFV